MHTYIKPLGILCTHSDKKNRGIACIYIYIYIYSKTFCKFCEPVV